MEKSSQDSAPTCNVKITRSGRASKPPVRYEPVEQVEDDYSDGEYDSHESSVSSREVDDESDETDDTEDADDEGNLEGFVVADKSESDSDSTEEDGKPPVPNKKRVPVQKRKGPVRK